MLWGKKKAEREGTEPWCHSRQKHRIPHTLPVLYLSPTHKPKWVTSSVKDHSTRTQTVFIDISSWGIWFCLFISVVHRKPDNGAELNCSNMFASFLDQDNLYTSLHTCNGLMNYKEWKTWKKTRGRWTGFQTILNITDCQALQVHSSACPHLSWPQMGRRLI